MEIIYNTNAPRKKKKGINILRQRGITFFGRLDTRSWIFIRVGCWLAFLVFVFSFSCFSSSPYLEEQRRRAQIEIAAPSIRTLGAGPVDVANFAGEF
jgi:hypothetical protein